MSPRMQPNQAHSITREGAVPLGGGAKEELGIGKLPPSNYVIFCSNAFALCNFPDWFLNHHR